MRIALHRGASREARKPDDVDRAFESAIEPLDGAGAELL